MTTMVMSSAIKSSDIGVSGKHKRNLQENKEEMQWVFLTTAKRRNSVEEQKLVRVDSKHQGSATCLQSDHELKAKYSEKWLNRHARNKESNLSTSVENTRKRDRLQSMRLPRRQQSVRESSLYRAKSAKTHNITGKKIIFFQRISKHFYTEYQSGILKIDQKRDVKCKSNDNE